MDDASIKEARTRMRQVQEHLLLAGKAHGAREENVGMVDVIFHPANPLGDLNYVTPRRNTAWVSAGYVEQGLSRLQALGRTPRVRYLEGLFPPAFGQTLLKLGLAHESRTALLAATVERLSEVPAVHPDTDTGNRRSLREGGTAWDVTALDDNGVGFAVAAFRDGALHVSLQVETQPQTGAARIVGFVPRQRADSVDLRRALLDAACRTAAQQGCPLLFVLVSDEDAPAYRELGFDDLGALVSYAAPADEGQAHERVAQSLSSSR